MYCTYHKDDSFEYSDKSSKEHVSDLGEQESSAFTDERVESCK